MKKVMFITIMALSLSSLFTSCNKKYKYTEIINERSIVDGRYFRTEKETEVISAKNDTLAYLKSFKRFCLSIKVYHRMKEDSYFVNIPIDFKLFNSDGINISKTIHFDSKEVEKEKILKYYFFTEEEISYFNDLEF
jgi:hypothetical protein